MYKRQEGLGRQLYPELNLWDTAQPFLERWVQERYSPQGMIKRLQRHAPSWLEQLPQLPDVVMDNLQQAREQELRSAEQQQRIDEMQAELDHQVRGRRRMLVGAALAGAALLYAVPGAWNFLASLPTASWVLLAGAAVLLWPRRG